MIIESGVIIFVGLLLIAIKLPIRTTLWALGRPVTLDVVVSILAYFLHYGTFSGVMAAAVAGMLTSGMTSSARYLIGFIDKNGYTPGHVWNLSEKLNSGNVQ